MIAEVVDRETRDLDFFGATAERVDQLVPILEKAATRRDTDTVRDRVSGATRHPTAGDHDRVQVLLSRPRCFAAGGRQRARQLTTLRVLIPVGPRTQPRRLSVSTMLGARAGAIRRNTPRIRRCWTDDMRDNLQVRELGTLEGLMRMDS